MEKLEERIIADMGLKLVTINDTWNMIKQEMESVATETIGYKTGGIRNNWYDDECKLATQAKNEAWLKTLQARATRTATLEYRTKRDIERKLFRKKKAASERKMFVQIQSLAETRDTRKLYENVKNVKNGYSQQPQLCKDSNGMVLAEERQCMERWTEFFKSQLSQSGPQALEDITEPDSQSNVQDVAEPTLEEVKASVFKLKNNKAPGSDNLPGELFKYGGDAQCTRLHELIVKIWEREEMRKRPST